MRDYSERDARLVDYIKCTCSMVFPIEVLIGHFKVLQQVEEVKEVRERILVEQQALVRDKMEVRQKTSSIKDFNIQVY